MDMMPLVSNSRDLIAVVMPLYGHAALVQEAIASVRRSNMGNHRTHVVVSVDGDPEGETFQQLLFASYGMADVDVIFSRNGGPGAARNRAIDHILSAIPEVKAVYFLDADNRVLPTTIECLYHLMLETGAGWVYTNIDTFGGRCCGNQDEDALLLRVASIR